MNKTPSESTRKTLYWWLLLSVLSLVFAGIFALFVALARTPVIEDMLPFGRDYIYVALVGHVDLAVVIWFLTFEGFLMVLTSTVNIGRREWSEALGWGSVVFAAGGMALVVIAAIFGLGRAELSNYVPVLLTPVFYSGLIFFAFGVTLNLINTSFTVFKAKAEGERIPVTTFGMLTAGLAVFVAMLCFALSGYLQMASGRAFPDFERLFWGGGHILQFANTIAMVTAWIYLCGLIFKKEPLGVASSKSLYAFYLLFVLPAPLIYYMYGVSTPAHKQSFTMLMQWGLGPSTGVFILAIAALMVSNGRRRWKDPGFSSLVLSMGIFLTGGVIGMLLKGVNTKVPAHYHCVIGAVTIAFMGLFYEIVPVVNKELYSRKMAAVQPYLYTVGLLLFAMGLFIAGGHGAARKTYGSDQNLDNIGKIIGMSVMGFGGLVAIGGGITFVLNALLTLFKKDISSGEPVAGRRPA